MNAVNVKRFRFGVNVRHARSRSEWVEKARKIEALGYDTFNAPDHLADFLAPLPALVSAAEATNHLRVGTNVLNNDLRHPVLVAREAATGDLLTDGRLQLGLGAGSIRSEYQQAGLEFDRGAVRVERLAEAIAIVKGLLAGEQVREADIVGLSGITFRDGGAARPDLSGWRASGADERVQLIRE